MKNFTTTAALLAAGLMAAGTAQGTVLIDDHFDNSDIATGGTNGGFVLITNGVTPSGTIGEAGTDAILTSAGSNDNTGITSISTFDPGTQPAGIIATYVVSSVEDGFGATSFWLDSDQAFGFADGFFDVAITPTDVRLIIDGPTADFEFIVEGGDITLDGASLLDGYTVTSTLTPAGWSVKLDGVTGLTDTGGTGLLSGNTISGAWTATTNYSNILDGTAHVAALNQALTQNAANIDRITVEAVPEPGSLALIGLGGLVLLRRRRA